MKMYYYSVLSLQVNVLHMCVFGREGQKAPQCNILQINPYLPFPLIVCYIRGYSVEFLPSCCFQLYMHEMEKLFGTEQFLI